MTRLCFGIFAQVLRLCKLENVTDRKLVGTMTRTVDPTCQYIHKDNASAVSRLFSCKGNLSNGNISESGSAAVKKPGESISDVISASQKADRSEVVQKFRENVIPLLDEDKKELVVLALLDIIEKDNVLDGDKKRSFVKYIGQTKNALLSFSVEERKIKENFRTRLDMELWWSHREFAENPLLLTIMLMTFEEYAEVPSKIYKFYEMAFETLAKKHDDTKLLDREFRSGLSKDKIAQYFAKICFLSYKDEKIELTESDFKNYFDRCLRNSLEEITATNLLHDLSNNLCLLIQEGEKYHFVHRSFQEYFCAINFKSGFEKVSTDRKETMSTGLISFFEGSRDNQSESVLEMLYDMVPEKVEEYIIIPKLEQILRDDDLRSNDGYWNVLERVFPNLKCCYEYHESIEYDSETDEEIDESYYDFVLGPDGRVVSKVMQFIIFNLLNLNEEDGFDDTYYDNEEIMEKVPIIVEEFESVIKEEMDTCKIIDDPESNVKVIEYSTFLEIIKSHGWGTYEYHTTFGGHEFWLLLDAIRKDNENHKALRYVIESKGFHLRKVCSIMQKYLSDLKAKQKVIDEEWADDFI